MKHVKLAHGMVKEIANYAVTCSKTKGENKINTKWGKEKKSEKRVVGEGSSKYKKNIICWLCTNCTSQY